MEDGDDDAHEQHEPLDDDALDAASGGVRGPVKGKLRKGARNQRGADSGEQGIVWVEIDEI